MPAQFIGPLAETVKVARRQLVAQWCSYQGKQAHTWAQCSGVVALLYGDIVETLLATRYAVVRLGRQLGMTCSVGVGGSGIVCIDSNVVGRKSAYFCKT